VNFNDIPAANELHTRVKSLRHLLFLVKLSSLSHIEIIIPFAQNDKEEVSLNRRRICDVLEIEISEALVQLTELGAYEYPEEPTPVPVEEPEPDPLDTLSVDTDPIETGNRLAKLLEDDDIPF
jgi:hypothetical protein